MPKYQSKGPGIHPYQQPAVAGSNPATSSKTLGIAMISRVFLVFIKILDLLRSPPKLRDAGGLTMNRKIKRIPQTTLSMKRAFDEFVVAQTAKGLTEPTIKNYHAHFHSISRHIDIEKSFSDLTQTDIDGMIVSMRKSGLATNWTVLHRSTCTACPSVSRCGCRSSAQGGLWCIAHSSSYAPRLM